jgi:hypothetical protein
VKAYITKTTISRRHLSIKGQKGISLIPALITICIFTLLTTQVIVPNQIRNANTALVNSLAKSSEILEQAILAYFSARGSWPTTITGDLVPQFLPTFDISTDLGGDWQIVDVATHKITGITHYNRPDMWAWDVTGTRYTHSKAIYIKTRSRESADSLVNKIGGHAKVSRQAPGYEHSFTLSETHLWDNVYISLVNLGTPAINDLNITQDIMVGRNIVLTGQIMAADRTTVLFDASASNPIAIQGHSHSSKQFKQNIHPLETPIENIYQLKPVSFDYKEAFKQYKTPNAANSEIGLIAEQVLPLIPEITLLDDDNKVMGIDYPKLSILLLSAIQALKGEVTALQKNNQQLQQQMDGLNVESEGLNIESEGLNIEGLNSANINNARTDNGTDE